VGVRLGGILGGGDAVLPIIYIGDGSGSSFGISTQFHELNDLDILKETGKEFFVFNNKTYSVEIVGRFTGPHHKALVFRDSEHIGRFVEGTETNRTFGYNKIFLHEEYLYYIFVRRGTVGFIMDWRTPIQRNEYYRFNLLTGQNEQITLTQYVETLQIYNSNFIINPEWSGER